jgi:hypothetical protein
MALFVNMGERHWEELFSPRKLLVYDMTFPETTIVYHFFVFFFFFDNKQHIEINSKKLLEPLQSQWLQFGVHSKVGTHEHDKDKHIILEKGPEKLQVELIIIWRGSRPSDFHFLRCCAPCSSLSGSLKPVE